MLLLAVLATVAVPPDLVVTGVVLRPDGPSVAVLKSGGRTRVVVPGETAFGGQVVRVAREGVVLAFGDVQTEVRVAGGVPAPPPVAVASRPPEEGGQSLDRKEVERRIGEEAPRILSETSLVPVLQNGAVAGLTLTRVPENSLLTEVGLQPGDILTEVNGIAVDGLPTLISLWPRLQAESAIHAVVLRGGRPVNINVKLR